MSRKYPSTQEWLEVERVEEDGIVVTRGGVAALLEVNPVNFTLLSVEEQDGYLAAYRAFLNGLSFPVEIVTATELLDLREYLESLRARVAEAPNEELAMLALAEHDFLRDLIQGRHLMTRRHFAVVWEERRSAAAKGGLNSAPTHTLTRKRHQLQAALEGMGFSCSVPAAAVVADQLAKAFGQADGLPAPVITEAGHR